MIVFAAMMFCIFMSHVASAMDMVHESGVSKGWLQGSVTPYLIGNQAQNIPYNYFNGLTPDFFEQAKTYVGNNGDPSVCIPVKTALQSHYYFKKYVGPKVLQELLSTISFCHKRGYLEELPSVVTVLAGAYMDILILQAQSEDMTLQNDSAFELGKMYALLAQLEAKGVIYTSSFIDNELSVTNERQNFFIRGIIEISKILSERLEPGGRIKIPLDVARVFQERIEMLKYSYKKIKGVLFRPNWFKQFLGEEIRQNNYYADFYEFRECRTLLRRVICNEDLALHVIGKIPFKYSNTGGYNGHSPLWCAITGDRWQVALAIIEKSDEESLAAVDNTGWSVLPLSLEYCTRSSSAQALLKRKEIALKIIQKIPVRSLIKSMPRCKRSPYDYALENKLLEIAQAIKERMRMQALFVLFAGLRAVKANRAIVQ